jgi:CheY-like chemotaxis protein
MDRPDISRAAILIAADQPGNLEILSKILQPCYRVCAPRSGEQALEAARREPCPELILLDIMMPGIDGYSVLTRSREEKGLKFGAQYGRFRSPEMGLIIQLKPTCWNDPATLLLNPAPDDIVRLSPEALSGGNDHEWL